MKVAELIKIVEDDEWFLIRQKGSHLIYKHPVKKGILVIPSHGSKDIKKGTLMSILKKAEINLLH